MTASAHENAHDGRHRASGHYRRLLAMIVLSYAIMYLLMYAMVDRPGNVFHNLNQVYMAGLMAAPMLLIEVLLMRSMYPDRRLNLLLGVCALLVALVCWLGIRGQWAIGDRQFLRSMIPHHAGAVLMCRQAELDAPDLRRLCDGIIRGQEAEIAQMKSRLE